MNVSKRSKKYKVKTKNYRINNTVLAAIFLSIGFILPIFTSQIKEIGDTLLPMHIPVMLCGLICGKNFGFFIGFILPFLRGVVFGMPPIYPNAIWMAIELATYGFVIGFVYSHIKRKNIMNIYISLLCAMITGRIAWGISKAILLGLNNTAFPFSVFIAGGFIDAIPGIIIQLILIPLIMEILNKRRIIK